MDQPKPKILPNSTTLTVRFFLRHGAMVEWPVPPAQTAQFSMNALVMNIRAGGCFVVEDLYIPSDEIACIGLSGATSRVVQPQHQRVQ